MSTPEYKKRKAGNIADFRARLTAAGLRERKFWIDPGDPKQTAAWERFKKKIKKMQEGKK